MGQKQGKSAKRDESDEQQNTNSRGSPRHSSKRPSLGSRASTPSNDVAEKRTSLTPASKSTTPTKSKESPEKKGRKTASPTKPAVEEVSLVSEKLEKQEVSPTLTPARSSLQTDSSGQNLEPLTPLIVNDVSNHALTSPQATSTPATANGMISDASPPLSPNSTDQSDEEAYTADKQFESHSRSSPSGSFSSQSTSSSVTRRLHSDPSANDRNTLTYGKFYNRSYLADSSRGYLKRNSLNPSDVSQRSPQYHRPENFSYTKEPPPFLRNKAGSGMMQLTGAKTVKVRRSSSPLPNLKNEEAVRLSTFPAGKPPLPDEVTKIEREDWPGPPSPAAILPEIMRQRRKSKGEEEDDDDVPKEDPKIRREIEEISKLKDRSGIGSVIYKELEERKSLPPQPLDPWKASRAPSAKYEPRFRTRYQSPMFASPSRFLDRPRRSWDDADIRAYRSFYKVSNYPVPKPGYGSYGITQKAATLPLSGMYGGPLDFRFFDMDDDSAPSPPQTAEEEKSPERSPVSTERRSKRTSTRAGEPGVYDGPSVSLMTFQRNTWHTEAKPPIYPYERLKITNFNLPKDVDRNTLELYLSKDEFEEVLKMPREKFYRLAEWKRNDIKRRHRLY